LSPISLHSFPFSFWRLPFRFPYIVLTRHFP
jgi:hypothetical protein